MNTSYICSSCRHKILASIRRQRPGQLRSNSTFVSLANPWSSTGDTASEETTPLRVPHSSKIKQSRVKYKKSIWEVRSPRIRSRDVLDSLFEEGRQRPHTAETLASRPTLPHLERQNLTSQSLEYSSSLINQKLRGALAERNLGQIDHLWAKARNFGQSKTTPAQENYSKESKDTGSIRTNNHRARQSISGEKENMSTELYDQFILSYMAMGKPHQAFDVWNYMVDASLNPTLSTWHAMLKGCRRSRSTTSLDAVWAKLRSSGMQPDVACWRTRISALIECGKPELGILALEEMGREWHESTKKKHNLKPGSTGHVNSAVKPTIETINDTVSGLINRGHLSTAKSILTWGGDFGIKPDVVTFNILIRGVIRNGSIESVAPLLAEMQSQGIQADVATFTTILDEIFKTSDSLSPEEQLRLTNLIFTEMEAAGVRPNQFTYNKIISSLLHTQSKDMKAVEAVLARMAAQKIEPSRDIYTMLVQQLFFRDPPDLGGVRSLLDRIRISGTVLDHIFWDRVIEGYASVGDTASALAVLGRVDKGAMAGWRALEMVLRALVHNGELETAEQVVRDVKVDRGGPPAVDQRGVEGQHSFWRAVGELGLMEP